ncbi:hypothetical protein D7X94_15930 [Acutalibacter sp. 1XD8-33]|uniref:hypothetical protein n=1 Tax=Acutalibacter sp. 1XD8-33 TaxID=2320081 RepID=UPI000EA24C31|nr:hypothetical protein [Acutalibacter sp. 1XD8-33]RKJ38563.1 hypothetical protein D7X94_15930 [Acutalibacter sp. 1XD8-33]
MKKFLRFVGELKTWGCLSFTGAVCIYSAIDWLTGGESMAYSLIWQLLAMCGVITLLQYVFFSGQVLKKLNYGLRLGIFCPLVFAVVLAFAWVFRWFPMERPGAWVSFVVIFLAAFLILCLGFELYFRIMGAKYDEHLGRAQKRSRDMKK